jgi:hypothetical protein
MTEEAIRRLLLDCGFSSKSARGARWTVAGELPGGLAIEVRCVSGRSGGTVLLVPSETARLWLLDVLTQNDAGPVDVRSEAISRGAGTARTLQLGTALAWLGTLLHTIAR